MSQQPNADDQDLPNKDASESSLPHVVGDKEAAASASLTSLEQWIEMVESTAPTVSPESTGHQPEFGEDRKGPNGSILKRARALERRVEAIEGAARKRARDAARPARRLAFRFVLAVVLLVPYFWLWQAFDRLASEREVAALFWTLAEDGVEKHERVSALLDLANRGHREWRSAHLRELDLKGAQLRDTSLLWIQFQSCSLKNARFDTADLSYATFNQSDLQGAVLSSARMHETFFQLCNLTAVDARGADLSGAHVQAQLSAGMFQNANFTRARLRGSRCIGARFDNAKFLDADLTGVDFSRCALTGADFHGAVLDEVKLVDANWWRAKGLTADQMSSYAEVFAPTEKASAEWREDFMEWKSEGR
jgi:uncharacterized protein YjbI with pentapeptide repeats